MPLYTLKTVEDSFGEVFSLTYDSETDTFPVYYLSNTRQAQNPKLGTLIDNDISLGQGMDAAIERFTSTLTRED